MSDLQPLKGRLCLNLLAGFLIIFSVDVFADDNIVETTSSNSWTGWVALLVSVVNIFLYAHKASKDKIHHETEEEKTFARKAFDRAVIDPIDKSLSELDKLSIMASSIDGRKALVDTRSTISELKKTGFHLTLLSKRYARQADLFLLAKHMDPVFEFEVAHNSDDQYLDDIFVEQLRIADLSDKPAVAAMAMLELVEFISHRRAALMVLLDNVGKKYILNAKIVKNDI